MAEEKSDGHHWTESLGVHRLDMTLEVAERLAKAYECTTPAGGLGPGTHCAACCYNTGIAATSMDEFETAQVLLAVPSLVAEIKRLRELHGE
jgi:hypothetical protein